MPYIMFGQKKKSWFTTDDAVKVQELTSFTIPKEYIRALGNLVNIESLRNDEK